MKHIINKLLLIGEINLIKDLLYFFKVTYIMCSAVVILPPTVEEWDKNKIIMHNGMWNTLYSYTNIDGIRFDSSIGSADWSWSMCIDPIISPPSDNYDILYNHYNNAVIYVNPQNLDIDCKNLWYNKKCFYDNFHSNEITPVYYFPPN